MRGGIFISYRRRRAEDFAGRLGDLLTAHSDAEWVFLDREIRPGADFMQVITESIARTDVFLVIIDPTWKHRWTGQRRLKKPNDPVRREIEAALDQTVPIIPVLMNDTPMPAAGT